LAEAIKHLKIMHGVKQLLHKKLLLTTATFDKRGPPQFGLLAKQNNPA
jgi:hypothetical protein